MGEAPSEKGLPSKLGRGSQDGVLFFSFFRCSAGVFTAQDRALLAIVFSNFRHTNSFKINSAITFLETQVVKNLDTIIKMRKSYVSVSLFGTQSGKMFPSLLS